MAEVRRQKHEIAEPEFRRLQGIEEMLRGHIVVDGRVSAEATDVAGGESREAAVDESGAAGFPEGSDSEAAAAAAARGRSRIQIRRLGRRAEETVIASAIDGGTNREPELLALAGLHAVSTIDSSFLFDPLRRRPQPQQPTERRRAGESFSLIQRWRELESRSSGEGGEIGDGALFHCALTPPRPPQVESGEEPPEIGDEERMRVRDIACRWTAEIGVTAANAAAASSASPGAGIQSKVAGIQREKWERGCDDGFVAEQGRRRPLMRLRGRPARLDMIMRIAAERQNELRRLSESCAVSEFPHRSKLQSLLRCRFLRNGSFARDERPLSTATGESGQVGQRHTFSALREGFPFRPENIIGANHLSDAHPSYLQGNSHSDIPCTHDLSVGRDRGSHTNVSEELFRNANADQEPTESIDGNTRLETEATLELSSISQDVTIESEGSLPTGEGLEGHGVDREWPHEAQGNEDNVVSEVPQGYEWQEDASAEIVGNRQDQMSGLDRWPYRFTPDDGDNAYSIEIRELLSRRSVSNLLRSGFRERLDRLIRSYVWRRGRVSDYSDSEGVLPELALPDGGDQDGQREDDDLSQIHHSSSAAWTPPLALHSPPPPPPPSQPLQHPDHHRGNWRRHHPACLSEIDWDIISDLKADMARLEQGIIQMQRMLEACMDMQMELQRSVRQEVSAALNRSTGENDVGLEVMTGYGAWWSLVKKGTCCVCCDAHIDALLYRCGHLCACSKCADKLLRGGGKCPLCRVPIVEVVRAYAIT